MSQSSPFPFFNPAVQAAPPGAPATAPVATTVAPAPNWQQAAQAATSAPAATGGVDPFAGVGDAKMFTKSAFFPTKHRFVVEVEEFKCIQSANEKHLGAILVIIECTILQSTDPTLPVGSRAAQVINMNKFGKPDLKAVVTAACGVNPGDPAQVAALVATGVFEGEKLKSLFGPTQPLRGRKMALQTTSKTPTSFTKHNWTPFTG